MKMKTVNDYVEVYGEPFRQLIENALKWLNSQEPLWNLDRPLNRDKFICDLVEKGTATAIDLNPVRGSVK
jgi:hypothetical protein